MLEVYMDDYIAFAIPRRQDQLHHAYNDIMTGIHDVFTLEKYDKEDAISLNKILKKEAAWAIIKNVMGFEVDRNPVEHTIWLTEDLRTDILTTLKNWIRKGEHWKRVSPLKNFEPILQNWDMHSLLSQL